MVEKTDKNGTRPGAIRTAAIFPGQGSQTPEMAAAYDSHPEVAAAVAEAAAAIDVDLPKVIADKTALDKTENTQPALLAVCAGVFRAAKISDVAAFAGHSLGEYAALVCADAIDFADAVKLVRRRAELMREAAAGGMAAILGDPAAAEKYCDEARKNGAQIWAANYNSPQQTVVSGRADAIAECAKWTANPGIKRVVPLPVSIPSHCPLMQPAADEFIADLRAIKWRTPAAPVLHNATLQYAESADAIVDALALQLVRPVRWTETVAKFAADEISRVYEFGPGGVLCGLAKRIPNAPQHIALATGADLEFGVRCRHCGLPHPLTECAARR
ncbi:MAG: ACP S-malonyltransferase [Gammaproteobacteria bacterium]